MRLHLSHYQESNKAIKIAIISLAVTLLFLAMPSKGMAQGLATYLPLHMLLEILGIVMALHVFSVVWQTREEGLPCNLILLAVTALAAGILDFSHMLTYAGMPDFFGSSDPERAINFWLAARFFNALGLILVAWNSWKIPLKIMRSWLMLLLLLGAVACLHWVFLWHGHTLPRTFSTETGLTAFKIVAEYLLMTMFFYSGGKICFQPKTKACL